jgi:polysaccharide export outer membrane protein
MRIVCRSAAQAGGNAARRPRFGLDRRVALGEDRSPSSARTPVKPRALAQALFLAILIATGPLVGGCGPKGTLPPLEQGGGGAYRLDSGDQLRVVVFGQQELTGSYTVDGSGMISMPLIPTVLARGLTTEELEGAIAAELGRGVVRNPSVTVQIEAFRPFFILGEVRKPGNYPYVHGMTVLTAVAIAGGFTERAQKSYVSITRTIDDEAVEARAERNTLVRPGDVIYVLERYF